MFFQAYLFQRRILMGGTFSAKHVNPIPELPMLKIMSLCMRQAAAYNWVSPRHVRSCQVKDRERQARNSCERRSSFVLDGDRCSGGFELVVRISSNEFGSIRTAVFSFDDVDATQVLEFTFDKCSFPANRFFLNRVR